MKSLSRVWPSATPWTAAYQAPPSMGFSRQEYWSGVPLPSPSELHKGTLLSEDQYALLEKTLMLGKLKAGEEWDDRGWDGWMASPSQWTRVWTSSRSSWWSGKPDVLQSMGSQRVGHDLVTELNWKQCFLDKRFTASKVLHLVIFTYAFCLKFSIFDSPHFYNPWKCYN